MIVLQARLFQTLKEPNGLRRALQTALELELATIPPYLVAAYSLTGPNQPIARLIRDVAREEMLHMVLVANLLNAVGGEPRLNEAVVVPSYPTHLPGAVQDDLLVPLAPFSHDLLRDVFMRIKSLTPLVIPIVEADAVTEPRTIGQFYAQVKQIIRDGGSAIFTGDPSRQIETSVDDDDAIVVTDVESAERAIDVIVGQGEGTSTSPFDAEGREAAHYYRFKAILLGKTLRKDTNVPEGHSFGPPLITFVPENVLPMKANLKASELPIDSPARQRADDLNLQYTRMLQLLHAGVNGRPAEIGDAVNIMTEFHGLAVQLMQIPIAPGVNAGPTFEFVGSL